MQSSDGLERPPDWPTRARTGQAVVSLVGVVAIGLVALLISIGAFLSGFAAGAKYILLFAILMFLAGVSAYVFNLRTPRSVSDIRVVDEGLEIRQSALAFGVVVALTACAAVLCLGGAIEMIASGYLGGAILPGLLGIFFASFFVALFAGQLRRGWVLLSRDGIRQRGWSFESYLPWGSIAGAKGAYNGYRMVLVFAYANADWQRRSTTWPWRIDTLPPFPAFEFDCRKFDIDPVVLCQLVTFYVNNPHVRDELGTATPLERVRTSSF